MLRPIYVVREKAVKDKQMKYVKSAVKVFLKLCGLLGRVVVVESDLTDEAGRDIRSYLSEARIGKRRKKRIDGDRLHDLVAEDLDSRFEHIDKRPQYIIILNRDLRFSSDDPLLIDGLAHGTHGVIVSVARTRSRTYSEKYFKMLVLHELGHMYGLISDARKASVTGRKYGRHCANECIMQGGTSFPKIRRGLFGAVLDRAIIEKFCPQCRRYLIRKSKLIIQRSRPRGL